MRKIIICLAQATNSVPVPFSRGFARRVTKGAVRLLHIHTDNDTSLGCGKGVRAYMRFALWRFGVAHG